MKVVKSLILGSAASLLAFGAQAADLPVKAKAVEYVKVCSLYGAGFYYIPGTDTCLKIGGYARIDTAFNSGIYANPYITSANGEDTRYRGNMTSRARIGFQMDTRTATEYGVLRTYANMQMQWTDAANGVTSTDGIAGGNFETDYAFIQFAGFTFGKAVSQFDPQWVLAIPSISSGHVASSDTKTGILQAAYTATFGNGFSGTISLEAPRPYRWHNVIETMSLNQNGYAFTSDLGGTKAPDIVGNLRLDQAWGSLHLGAAAHQVNHGYNGVPAGFDQYAATSAGSKWGYAVTAGFEIKNLPTGVGDSLRGDFTYAKGATRYVLGGTQNIPGAAYLIGSSSSITAALASDAIVNATGDGLDLSTAWAGRLFYEHYWNPQWRTSLYGIYAKHTNGNTSMLALPATLTGTTDFSIYQIGSRTAWSPVKNLTFSGEVMYTGLNTDLSGTVGVGPNLREWKSNAGTVSGIVQVLRSF